jgi:hypothetical protein
MIELWLGDPDDRYGVITIRKGDDLLDWAQAKKKNIWLERRLISATFKMELLRPKRELAITVRPPNVAMYSRGPVAAIIEAWLMSNFPAWVFDAEREEAPRFTPTIGFRLVEQAKNPSSVDDGKFDVIRHFQDVGFSAVFGDNALETRKVALLSELMIGVKIGVLDFDVSDKDAVYDSAFRQAQDRFEGIVLRVSDERMKQVLKIVDLAIRKELQHEGHLRINVMLPIDNSRLQVAYSFNMDGTLDTDDRLILGRDQGASGACWRDLEAIACNLEEARVTYADVWRMDKYQQCLVRKSLKSLLSVPLFSPNANSLEEGFVGVLNFDSDEQLFDSFTRLGQNDEDGYLLSCTQMIAERLTNWRLV